MCLCGGYGCSNCDPSFYDNTVRPAGPGNSEKEFFVLLADGDGTMRSSDEPFGVAVTTEDEAKRYVAEKGVGYTHSYCKVTVFDNKEDALNFAFPGRQERRRNNKREKQI